LFFASLLFVNIDFRVPLSDGIKMKLIYGGLFIVTAISFFVDSDAITAKLFRATGSKPILQLETSLFAAKQKTASKKSPTTFISIEDRFGGLWLLDSAINSLKSGGIGVIPTDTCYSFVTPITSKEGVEKLMALKGVAGQKKPLSVLCKDFSTISKYTSDITSQKWVFKMLRSTLPGPFTYIMPASKEVPKLVVENEKIVRRWRRKEIGVRMPDDPICMHLLEALDVPLLCGSVPEAAEDELGLLSLSASLSDEEGFDEGDSSGGKYVFDEEEDINHEIFRNDYMSNPNACSWFNQVDFIIENGPRGVVLDDFIGDIAPFAAKGGKNKKAVDANLITKGGLSTVVDLTSGAPVVLRQGKGIFDFDSLSL
jgi:tRNA threonylcarbamoyl adenosine modification protein (Sua5/YciO/YrdC/YwlC family)